MISQYELKEVLDYDMNTGLFTWKTKNQKHNVGDIAGGDDGQGYIRICINKKTIRAHRLAWLYMTGEIPDVIDHINRIKSDNRFSNLRNVSPYENSINRGATKRSLSGSKGVSFNKNLNKWRARITAFGKKIHIGYYENLEDAKEAYMNTSLHFFGNVYQDS